MISPKHTVLTIAYALTAARVARVLNSAHEVRARSP